MATRDKKYNEKIREIQKIIHSLKEDKNIALDSKYKGGVDLIKEVENLIEEVEYKVEILN